MASLWHPPGVLIFFFTVGLAWLLAAGQGFPQERMKPKVCPPPEGFRAMLHLFDNRAPTLQAYPVVGVPPPKDLFKYFGQDMEPRCALERTIADLMAFRVEYAEGMAVSPKTFTLTQLSRLHRLSSRSFKRYQWCVLMQNARSPEFGYDGSKVPEIQEGVETMFRQGFDSARTFVELSELYVDGFKGLENTAKEAAKRLSADSAARRAGKPRKKEEIDRDEKVVREYKQHLAALRKFAASLDEGVLCYRTIATIHTPAKYTWTSLGNPTSLLVPLAVRLVALAKDMRERLERG